MRAAAFAGRRKPGTTNILGGNCHPFVYQEWAGRANCRLSDWNRGRRRELPERQW